MSTLSVGTVVVLIPLSIPARIVAIFEDPLGVQYRVRYWWNGETKFEYVYPDEVA